MKFEKWQFAFGDSGMCMRQWKTSGDENGLQRINAPKGRKGLRIRKVGISVQH